MEKRQRPAFGMFSDIRRNGTSYLLVLPAMVYTFIFGYMTYPYILIAFQRFNYTKGIFHSEWVGLKNFEFFFGSSKAFTVTFNTIFLNLLFIVFGTLTALAISLILNELRKKLFVKISQSMMLFPNFISWIVISYVLYAFFFYGYGDREQIAEPAWPRLGQLVHRAEGMAGCSYRHACVERSRDERHHLSGYHHRDR